ncbi:MAG TPA: apolipoprotein N-acyltransferase [Bacteroidetes bacterium]|nr:apolipoprotein N-acyltransferase [Bacteroidota bacterium]HCN38373.1 apolipoprotein N-acyltransferase [Bacteroidota bacterium]
MKLTESIFNARILIIILTGICFGLSFPPVNFHYLIFLALVSYISIIINCNSYLQVFRISFLIFLFSGLTAISWIALSGFREGADWFIIVGGVFTILFHTIFYIIPSLIFYFIYKHTKDFKFKYVFLITFPFVWVGFEYLQTLGQINFPWLIIAYTQTYNIDKIQFADITGMFGVSFWICIISCLLYLIIRLIREEKINLKSPLLFILIFITLIVYLLPSFYKHAPENENREGLKLGIIQPNINPWKKWGSKYKELNLDYINQYKEITKDTSVKLVIMPETAFPFYFRYDFYNEQYLLFKNVIDSVGVPLLTGSPDLYVYGKDEETPVDARKFDNTDKFYDVFNSALLINPGEPKDSITIYNKIKLVAGSERMPYQEKLTFLRDLIKWGVGISAFQTGNDTVLFNINNYLFNTAICYESVFPGFISEFVNKGSEFIVIITNDGWWGELSGTYQHNQYAVFRAIENRRWIARCANTGISCFITPKGEMKNETGINEKINISEVIFPKKDLTFYTKYGDWFAKICLYLTISVFIILLTVKFVRRKNSPVIKN